MKQHLHGDLMVWALALAAGGGQLWGAEAADRPVDQLFTLDKQPVVIRTKELIAAGAAALSPTELPRVINRVLNANGACAPVNDTATACLRADTYYILHLLEHEPGKVETRRDLWYVYFAGWKSSTPFAVLWDPEMKRHYQQARMFGARRLTMLYLHSSVVVALRDDQHVLAEKYYAQMSTELRSAKAAAGSDTEAQARAAATWWSTHLDDAGVIAAMKSAAAAPKPVAEPSNATAATKAPKPPTAGALYEEALSAAPDRVVLSEEEKAMARTRARQIVDAAIDGIIHKVTPKIPLTTPGGAALTALEFYDDKPHEAGAFLDSSFLPIVYRVEVTKKEPDNLQNFGALFSAILTAGTEKLTAQMTEPDYGLCSVKEGMQIDYVTSDIAVKGFRGGKPGGIGEDAPTEIGTKLFDNERKYWFDFSFAVPLKSISELEAGDSGGSATLRTVNKKNLFAAVNVFPFPVDTKNIRWRLIPQLIYGLNITGKPLDKQLLAVGIGTSIVQPFFGRIYDRSSVTDPVSGRAIRNNTWTWTWGVNIAPRSVLSSLKKAAGSK